MSTRRRLPGWVYDHGDEPDPRFSLANERTFLAWLGTGLALLSAGVGLHSLSRGAGRTSNPAAEIVLVVLGLLCPVQAVIGWARAERALREGRPLPGPGLAPVLAVGLLVAGALYLVLDVL